MRFQTSVFLAAITLTISFNLFASIGIQLQLDRKNYLQYEPIKAKVTLHNYSGNTLIFGGGGSVSGSVFFKIIDEQDRSVSPYETGQNFAEGLILGAGETKELPITLNKYYNLSKLCGYSISARVSHNRLKNDMITDSAYISVKTGMIFSKCKIGVPVADPTAPIQSRDVAILIFQEEERDVFCLLIEDDKTVYNVTRLGHRLRGANPMMDIDAMSNVHVLVQVKPRLYNYRIYDYNGNLKMEKHYLPQATAPVMIRDEALGRVLVTGGREAVSGIDFYPKEMGVRTKLDVPDSMQRRSSRSPRTFSPSRPRR